MTTLQIDATTTTTDSTCIASHATKYYKELFQPPVEEADIAREDALHYLLQTTHEAAEHPMAHLSAEHVQTSIASCPPRRTCASDGVVTELWQTATLACPQIAMMMAWAINMTITNCGPPQRRAHHAGEHAHAQEGGGEGRAHAREGGDAVSASADANADAHAMHEPDASLSRTIDVCLLPKQQSPKNSNFCAP